MLRTILILRYIICSYRLGYDKALRQNSCVNGGGGHTPLLAASTMVTSPSAVSESRRSSSSLLKRGISMGGPWASISEVGNTLYFILFLKPTFCNAFSVSQSVECVWQCYIIHCSPRIDRTGRTTGGDHFLGLWRTGEEHWVQCSSPGATGWTLVQCSSLWPKPSDFAFT